MTTTIVAVSDLHGGSTLGLCPPEITLYEEGTYRANEYQQWLWQTWEEFWTRARKMARGKRVIVFNGDLVDGNHHKTVQLVSPNETDHVEIAVVCIRRALEIFKPSVLIFTRGTEAHVGGAGVWDEAVARAFKDKIPYKPPFSRYNVWLDTEGVLFHFAHHTSGWGRPWTATGAPGREAVMMLHDAATRRLEANEGEGVQVPDVSVRGHQHRFNDSGMATHPRVFVLPGWQLQTAFGHRIAPGRGPEVGGMVFQVKNGGYTPHVMRWFVPLSDDAHITL